MMARGVVAGLAAAGAFLLDRSSKAVASAQQAEGATQDVLGEWVRLAHVHNSGSAFGLFPGSAPLLALVSLPVLLALGWTFLYRAEGSLLAFLIVGAVVGAGSSNTLDRALTGYVDDFIDIGLPAGPRFWAFNLSDSTLVLGVLAALILSLRRRDSRARDPGLSHFAD